MMSEEQFFRMMQKLEDSRSQNLREVLSAVMPAREDRDRLIRMEGQLNAQLTLTTSMRTEDLAKISEADTKAAAAHRRIDAMGRWINGGVLVTVSGMILTALFVYMRLPR